MNSPLPLSNYIILDRIGDFLHSSHLLQCVLVSKEWNNCFTPKLWKYIDLRWKIDPVSISRHQFHIHSITSLNELEKLDFGNVHFPNLRHILSYGMLDIFDRTDLGGYANYMSSQFSELCLDFLSHSTKLESLHLYIPKNNPIDSIYRIPNVIRNLAGLRRLDITIRLPVTLALLQDIIYNANRCETLYITIAVNETDITTQIDNLKKSIAQLPETNIRNLSIKTLGTYVDIETVAPVLEKSPQVVSLYLCHPYTLETLRHISKLLLDHNRPQLKYLGIEETVNHYQEHPVYWETVQSIFQDVASKHMLSVKRPTLCFKHTSAPESRIIQHDEDIRMDTREDIIVDVYSRCFSHTLTSLELEGYSINKLIVLLSRLPLLQTIAVHCNLFRTSGFEYQRMERMAKDNNDIAEMTRSSWTGLQIKKFRISILYHSNSLSNALLDCLFVNIGRLELLEELSFRSTHDIFAILSTKYLGYLTPRLTHLSQVNLCDHGHRITSAIATDPIKNIMLIVKSWTGLRYLGLQSRTIQTSQRAIIRDIVNQHNIVLNLFEDIQHIQ